VASRSLGTLTLDLVAKIGGFTRGLDEAERKADSTARAIARKQAQRAKEMEKLAVGIGAAVGAIAAAAGVAFVAIDQLAKSAANFKDLEETTGASAEGLASMAVAAATAGVSMDEIAANSIRLTKGLMGVDGESKAAAAGIKALGLNLADFKKLDPIGQTDALTKAFAGFADGAGKTAVATALWGKSGAEMLKVMKALNEQGGRTVILTQAQIETADAYADSQAKAVAELKQYAQVAAIQALPAITALISEFTKAITAVTGLSKESASLAANNGIRDFSQGAAIAIATVGEALVGLFKLVRAVGGSFESVFADIQFGLQIAGNAQILNNGGFFNSENRAALVKALDNRNKIAAEANARYVALFTESGTAVTDALRKQFAAMNAGLTGFRNDAFTDPRSLTFGKPPKLPELRFGDGGGKKKKAKEEVDEVKKALEELEKELALFGQDDSFKKAFEFEGLGATNKQLEHYKANLKELKRLETAGEIQKTIDALVKERDELGLTNEQLTIQKLLLQGATEEQIRFAESVTATIQAFKDQKAIRDAQDAADDYINSLKRASEAEIQLIGKGAKERQRINGRLAMEDRFEEQRRALNRSRIDASLSPGGFGPEQQRRYEQELEIIRATQAEALKIYDATYQQRMQMEADWQVGASEAANDYITNASNIAAQTNDLFTNAFQGMEDALVKFVTTGKLDFKSLANSILVDITRIIIKQTIMNALMSAFGMGGTGPIGFASVAGISGGRADGGPVEAGKSYFVGERGPEIFSPNTNGTILPNGVMPKAQAQQIINISVPVQGMVDRRTREQIASTVAMELGRSRSRASA
jgi:lambda family phage tail tape measure protein